MPSPKILTASGIIFMPCNGPAGGELHLNGECFASGFASLSEARRFVRHFDLGNRDGGYQRCAIIGNAEPGNAEYDALVKRYGFFDWGE